MSQTCGCSHEQPMDDLILAALKAAVEQYPEIVPYLKGHAAKIIADGVEWHMKLEPYQGDDRPDYIGDDFEITQEDIDEAIAEWDRLMPDYAGMLNAKIEVSDNE